MPRNPRSLAAEQAYRARLRALQRSVVLAAAGRWRGIDQDDIAAGIRPAIRDAARIIANGQQTAQTAARGFVGLYGSLELGRSFAPILDTPAIAGTTYDGRTLERAAAGVPATVYRALGLGLGADYALRAGMARLGRLAATETMDAARREQQAQEAGSRSIIGWQAVSGGGTSCVACLALQDGQTHPADDVFATHPACSCIRVPVFDVPQTVERPTGQDIFDSLSPDQQAARFAADGEAKAEAVRDGRVSLGDLITTDQGPSWRATTTEAPLDALEA